MSRAFRPCVVAIALIALAVLRLGAQSPIQYVYDEIGRLIAVIDPSGDTATYTYDAVGNVLAIGRHASTQVSVISFTPVSGPVGTVVTIRGTGFSATANQNTVTFHGTGATVSAATTTQLTVTVPGGATTGTIAVTAPGGSDTSANSFTVASLNTPTVTSFTPTIGLAGTSVSITGTNFDTTPLKNRLKVNVTSVAASSATSTSLSTVVPSNAGSGHISVSTAAGQGVSTDDFYVPPYPYVASDVVYTGRMGFSDAESVVISTANKVGLAIFDATAGQKVSVRSVIGPMGSLTLYNPTGVLLTTVSSGVSTAFIEPLVAPNTGTYTVLVDPTLSGTGTTTVTAYNVPADASGTISDNGTTANLSITVPGQNGFLTFSGTASQRVSLKAGSSNPSGTASLRKPDGTNLATLSVSGIFTSFLEPVTLPTTGTYTIYYDPTTGGTGTGAFNLYDMPADVSGSITPNGSSANVVITTPGQNGELTFSGTSGHRMSLKVNSGPSGTVYLKKPDGSTLASASIPIVSSSFIEPQTLPTTGTYSLFVDLSGSNTGTVTLTLYDVADDITGSITAGGSSVSVGITSPGQNGLLTFSGTTGDRRSVKLDAGAPAGTLSILNPNGTTLGTTTTSTFLDTKTLTATGTHTVKVDPSGATIGTAVVTLYAVPADTSGSLTIGGSAVGVTLSTPGQNGAYTFSGTASQLLTVHITSNTMSSVLVKLLKPDGSTLTSTTSSSGSFNLTQQTLPTTGTYTVAIDPQAASTGSLNVAVTSP